MATVNRVYCTTEEQALKLLTAALAVDGQSVEVEMPNGTICGVGYPALSPTSISWASAPGTIKSEYTLPSGVRIKVHEVKDGNVHYSGPWLSFLPEWMEVGEFLAWVSPKA